MGEWSERGDLLYHSRIKEFTNLLRISNHISSRLTDMRAVSDNVTSD